MCSSQYLFSKHFLLLLCTIILSTCGGEIDNSDGESTTASTIETTIVNDDDNSAREELTTIKQIADTEAQLPVDLLSDDVLLDPNVVLARLSRRDLGTMERRRQPEYFDGYNEWSKSHGIITRRQDNSYREYEEKPRKYVQKKMKIYPVFPGK